MARALSCVMCVGFLALDTPLGVEGSREVALSTEPIELPHFMFEDSGDHLSDADLQNSYVEAKKMFLDYILKQVETKSLGDYTDKTDACSGFQIVEIRRVCEQIWEDESRKSETDAMWGELKDIRTEVQQLEGNKSMGEIVKSCMSDAEHAEAEIQELGCETNKQSRIANATKRISKKLLLLQPGQALAAGIALNLAAMSNWGGWSMASWGLAHGFIVPMLIGCLYGGTMFMAAPVLHGVGVLAVAHGITSFPHVKAILVHYAPKKMAHLEQLLQKAKNE